MPSGPIEFVRLIDGRLWHVTGSADHTMCGALVRREDAKLPELVKEHVPSGAWVCDRCVLELLRRGQVALQAAKADPRRRDSGARPPLTIVDEVYRIIEPKEAP